MEMQFQKHSALLSTIW